MNSTWGHYSKAPILLTNVTHFEELWEQKDHFNLQGFSFLRHITFPLTCFFSFRRSLLETRKLLEECELHLPYGTIPLLGND